MKNRELKKLAKIPKGTEINDEVLYVFKGRTYLDKPKGAYVAEYRQGSEGRVYAITKKDCWVPHILLMVLICYLVYRIETIEPKEYTVSMPNTIRSNQEFVELNVVNEESNDCSLSVQLLLEGTPITDEVTIDVGNSVGYLSVTEVPVGSHMCKMRIVFNRSEPLVEEYDVLLIVEE